VSEFAIVGRIRKPHGIHGDLVVQSICDTPRAVFAPGRVVYVGDTSGEPESASPRAAHVTRSRPFKDGWLVGLQGIHDRNDAELWRERYLLVPSSELTPPAEGEVWLHELPGFRAVGVDGALIGTVREVMSYPQGLMLDLETPRGSVIIPFVDAIVVRVNRDARELTVDPPEGLLDL
jgi:16S rRNA processing protein RimM